MAELENINRIVIQSPDTDVKIIACHQQSTVLINLPKLWFKTGTGSKRRYIPFHDIVEKLGYTFCKMLPGFHFIKGCDSTSILSGIGIKERFWNSKKRLSTTFRSSEFRWHFRISN